MMSSGEETVTGSLILRHVIVSMPVAACKIHCLGLLAAVLIITGGFKNCADLAMRRILQVSS